MPTVQPIRIAASLCLTALVAPGSVLAQEEVDLSEISRESMDATLERMITCSQAADDEVRLACFDEAVIAVRPQNGRQEEASSDSAPGEEASAAAEVAPSADPGDWRVRAMANPIDDSPTVVLTLTAESGRSEYGKSVIFVARCQSNTTEAYIDWGTYVGDDSSSVYDEWKHVTIRIGSGDAVRQRWGVSTDKEATFAPDWAGNLLKQMLGADRMVAQMTPYGANPITAIFETEGLDAVLPELAETCNWS